MGLKVVGAGYPRTGTTSLRSGLERLLGGPCYHMQEMGKNDDHQQLWARALDGDMAALDQVLDGYVGAVDWPTALFWRELMERHPDAIVVLSKRADAATWWNSADRTVWDLMRQPDNGERFDVFHHNMRTKAGLGNDWDDPVAMQAYYESHIDEVIATVPSDRLVVWQPSDGWGPLCSALDMAVPDEDFAHNNPGESFREKWGLDKPGRK